MELIFKGYSSIENVERTKEIDTIIQQGKSGGEWVVSEKIHGANFSFWVTEDSIRCAKRTDWLSEGSSFFNFQDVLTMNFEVLRKMYDDVITRHFPETKCMTVYGEIFGGNYPHPEVERAYMATTVQKGVWYHPGNRFMAFDIVIRSEDHNRTMGHDFVYDLCELHGLKHVPVLFRGTFEECLKYPNEFNSVVPNAFYLPSLVENLAEGVVIKPVEPSFMWNGSRVILKNKNTKWSEKAKMQRPNKDANKANKFDFELSEPAAELVGELLLYVTENRLRNVLSKMEAITDRHFGIIVGNMNKDIMEDFLKDHREKFIALEEKERKYATKKMGNEVMLMVRKDFLNIIDGTF